MARHAAELYEQDFYAWAQDQAAALRRMQAERWNGPLDLPHLAEQIEHAAMNDLAAFQSQLERIIHHLLKLEHSPSPLPRRGWINSVDAARGILNTIVSESIRQKTEPFLERHYRRARKSARLELLDHHERQAADALPDSCPYSWQELLAEDWYPPNRHGLVDET